MTNGCRIPGCSTPEVRDAPNWQTFSRPPPPGWHGDLTEACLESRADLLVTRKPPGGFDLVSVAVPIDFQPTEIKAVVAAVAGGRHSELNVSLAEAIGRRLGVETFAATAYFAEAAEAGSPSDPRPGRLRVARDEATGDRGRRPHRIHRQAPGALPSHSRRTREAPFCSRLFFGPGARLKAKAPAGAVMVRYSPPRVFQQHVGTRLLRTLASRRRQLAPPQQRPHRGRRQWSPGRGGATIGPGSGRSGSHVVRVDGAADLDSVGPEDRGPRRRSCTHGPGPIPVVDQAVGSSGRLARAPPTDLLGECTGGSLRAPFGKTPPLAVGRLRRAWQCWSSSI